MQESEKEHDNEKESRNQMAWNERLQFKSELILQDSDALNAASRFRDKKYLPKKETNKCK